MLNKMESAGPRQIADHAMRVLDDHKATDLCCLDVAHLTTLMDFMIVATGRSGRHVRSLGDALVESCKEDGIDVLGIEGKDSAEWLLVDLVEVVVHIMLPRSRDFYEIEKLWDISPRDDDANRGHIGIR